MRLRFTLTTQALEDLKIIRILHGRMDIENRLTDPAEQ
jgi:hypothetical protein